LTNEVVGSLHPNRVGALADLGRRKILISRIGGLRYANQNSESATLVLPHKPRVARHIGG
jgi:hypothetical protein